VKRSTILALLVTTIGALAFLAAGCGGGGGETTGATGTAGGGGGGSTSAIDELPAASCGPLEYKGTGDAQALLVSDLPLQGGSRTQTLQMNDAMRYELDQAGWKAGNTYIAFQACDDSTAQAAKWDPGKCTQNANAYAQNKSVVGVIGTFNSGCAQLIIPRLNRAAGGAIPMISPANTLVCITEGGPGCAADEPDKYYPSGTRNYARVAPHDAYQGAAMSEFAQSKGVKSVYILNDKEAYGLGVATNFKNAAESLGIKVLGFDAYDPTQPSFEATFNKIKQTQPDAVFIGGLIDENSGQLINDKVTVLGPNTDNPNDGVMLLLPDGFTTDAVFDPKEGGTKNAKGAYFSVAGVPTDQFKGAGAEFAQGFGATLGGTPVEPYSVYGAQAAQIFLDAIGKAGTDRAGILDAIFSYKVTDGLIGSFEINENGDPSGGSGAVVGFTVYKGTDQLTTETTISPKPEDVDAARG
jgi:branched-chain amino acid transport system substrate-binding protein